jgi:hypothetical protein
VAAAWWAVPQPRLLPLSQHCRVCRRRADICLSSIFELRTTLRDGVESISSSVLAIKDHCSARCYGAGQRAGKKVPSTYRETHRPYSEHAEHATLISILAHNQARRHWVYSGHYPRIFVAPKNARNAETKHWSGAVPISLLALLALTTSTYTSLGVLQELNPQPQLLKALV